MTRPARPRHLAYRGLGVTGFHDLHAVEWGSRRSARVVICAHGYSGNGRDFDRLAAALAADGARVVCPDFAGRGRSAWLPAYGYHFTQFLADVRSLLAHLGVAQVDWVGTSMGGLLGMLLASQASSPVRRLVMNDVGAYLPADALRHIARNLHAEPRFASLAQVEAHLRHTHREWGEIDDAQWRRMAVHHAERTDDGYRLHYDPQIAQVVQAPPFAPGLYFWDAWYRVRCPALLLRGETSEVFPPDVARAMLDARPGTELAEIPGAGHAPSLMVPEQIALVRDWLAAEPPAARGVSSGRHEPSQRLHPPRAA